METITLTRENAHRVTMVRRKDAPDSAPVPFVFRGKRYGYCSYSHLVGFAGQEEVLPSNNFGEWEVVEVAHPGYLEEFFKRACDAYNCTSHSPEERGESEIASHERQLHDDLMGMPEEQRGRYLENYKKRYSDIIAANSRCFSAMIVGPARFNNRKCEQADNAYRKAVENFMQWRERALESIAKAIEAAKPEEQRQEEAWQELKKDLDRTITSIHALDTGKERGYNRALFVNNLAGRLTTIAGKGNVELIERAVAYIREWNAKFTKPVVTERHSIFKLPETARKVREQQEERENKQNKEVSFDKGKVVWNYAEDRLQIIFDQIPDAEMRMELKRHAFKWSPRNQAWQRQLTRNAEYAARQVLKIEL